jgi:hypothetical protein
MAVDCVAVRYRDAILVAPGIVSRQKKPKYGLAAMRFRAELHIREDTRPRRYGLV